MLDEQVKFLDERSLHSSATWLLRRWNRCEDLFREVDEGLKEIDHTVDVLRAEWNAQIIAQTKPAPSMVSNSPFE